MIQNNLYSDSAHFTHSPLAAVEDIKWSEKAVAGGGDSDTGWPRPWDKSEDTTPGRGHETLQPAAPVSTVLQDNLAQQTTKLLYAEDIE